MPGEGKGKGKGKGTWGRSYPTKAAWKSMCPGPSPAQWVQWYPAKGTAKGGKAAGAFFTGPGHQLDAEIGSWGSGGDWASAPGAMLANLCRRHAQRPRSRQSPRRIPSSPWPLIKVKSSRPLVEPRPLFLCPWPRAEEEQNQLGKCDKVGRRLQPQRVRVR